MLRDEDVLLKDLSGRAVFAGIGLPALESLLSVAKKITLNEGVPVPYEINNKEAIHLIISGGVDIWLDGTPGKDVFLTWRGKEQILGEFKAFSQEKVRGKTIANMKTELLTIPADIFVQFANEHLLVFRNLCRLLIAKAELANVLAEFMNASTPEQKAAKVLLYILKEWGGKRSSDSKKIVVKRKVTQKFAAGIFGGERRSALRGMQRLKAQKVIGYADQGGDGTLTILDLKKLKSFAKG